MITTSSSNNIPQEFIVIYDELCNDVSEMSAKWQIHQELFRQSQRRIDLLNECAMTFFSFIQNVMCNDVLMALSKLTDPSKTGKHENISLERLQELLESHGDMKLSKNCHSILNDLQIQCKPFRDYRNKRLAHSSVLKTPQEISYDMINKSLLLVHSYLNVIESNYNKSSVDYNDISISGSSDDLFYFLRLGLRYKELVLEDALPLDDLNKGKWNDI